MPEPPRCETTGQGWMPAARSAHQTGPASRDDAGTRSRGPMMSSDSASKLADVLPNRRRHRAPSAPCIPSAVASTERYSTPALPPSSGWTQSISGRRQDRPYRSRPSPARNCEPTAIGWIAEQWSCSRPGMIASLVRVPPPMSSAASRTVTWRPALARATAAARPFGPAPTTIAVLMPRLPLAPVLARSSLRSSLALGFGCVMPAPRDRDPRASCRRATR